MQLRSGQAGTMAVLLMVALGLTACANPDVFDPNERWFSRPFDLVSRNGGYTFSELKESRTTRPVTPNDLVDNNGNCPPLASAVPAAAPEPTAVAAAGGGPAPGADPADPLLGGGIALGMTECDVVYRAGHPTAVQLGNNPNGDRTAILTYDGRPRPGIYRFEGGRLMDMDGVATAAPEPQQPKRAKRRVVRKKKERTGAEQVSTE